MTIALAEMSNRQRECVIKQLPHKYIFLKAVIFLAIAGQEALLIKIFQCHRELYQISHRTSSQSPEEIITSLSQLETAMKNETIFGHTIVILFTNHRETASYWIRSLIGNNYIQAHIPIFLKATLYNVQTK